MRQVCIALGILMLLAVCSCAYPARRADSPASGKSPEPVRCLGLKVLSRISAITLNLRNDGQIIEQVPLSLGFTYRESDTAGGSPPETAVEVSLDLLVGQGDYGTDGIERHVENSAARLTFLQLWDIGEGFYAGLGGGVQLGEIRMKDTDYRWVPPQTYHKYRFVFQPVFQAKAGYETGNGFFFEGTASIGIGISIWSLELSAGFYF